VLERPASGARFLDQRESRLEINLYLLYRLGLNAHCRTASEEPSKYASEYASRGRHLRLCRSDMPADDERCRWPALQLARSFFSDAPRGRQGGGVWLGSSNGAEGDGERPNLQDLSEECHNTRDAGRVTVADADDAYSRGGSFVVSRIGEARSRRCLEAPRTGPSCRQV